MRSVQMRLDPPDSPGPVGTVFEIGRCLDDVSTYILTFCYVCLGLASASAFTWSSADHRLDARIRIEPCPPDASPGVVFSGTRSVSCLVTGRIPRQRTIDYAKYR